MRPPLDSVEYGRACGLVGPKFPKGCKVLQVRLRIDLGVLEGDGILVR